MEYSNYYELLDIPQDADTQTIKDAIRAVRRRYRVLTESPDMEKRSKGERIMADLAEAEKTLYDAQLRADYDEQLLNEESYEYEDESEEEYEDEEDEEYEDEPQPYNPNYDDEEEILRRAEYIRWERQRKAEEEARRRHEEQERRRKEQERARYEAEQRRRVEAAKTWHESVLKYRQARDFKNMLHAAQNLTELDPKSLVGWEALAESQLEWGKYNEAMMALSRARQLSRGPSDYHTYLEGLILGNQGNGQRAVEIFLDLVNKEPSNADYIAKYIWSLRVARQVTHAVSEGEKAHQAFPEDTGISRQYGNALYDVAEASAYTHNGRVYITSSQQVHTYQESLAKIKELIPQVPELQNLADLLQENIKIAMGRQLRPGSILVRVAWVALVISGFNLIGSVFSLVVVISALELASSIALLMPVLMQLGIIWLCFNYVYPRTWRINKAIYG
ncbi:MAG: hypothetical protein Q4P78_07545 [Rothia sp. (in: high G+C Gram-positive bacteria)]|uniref:hypothetical protein n=1 Tax=Rothia sp. (in: high G+C Gram-positive bacteria) TaxID=1885016 RepID=UPI0026DEB45A|nr:hypothetical protein [Rothia sp. (in: high G+C Gram-positive bacteria)]MDO5751031.1 hypothetical protein [Rothia sp. (in: high G+C Gram-positive bacteria)]